MLGLPCSKEKEATTAVRVALNSHRRVPQIGKKVEREGRRRSRSSVERRMTQETGKARFTSASRREAAGDTVSRNERRDPKRTYRREINCWRNCIVERLADRTWSQLQSRRADMYIRGRGLFPRTTAKTMSGSSFSMPDESLRIYSPGSPPGSIRRQTEFRLSSLLMKNPPRRGSIHSLGRSLFKIAFGDRLRRLRQLHSKRSTESSVVANRTLPLKTAGRIAYARVPGGNLSIFIALQPVSIILMSKTGCPSLVRWLHERRYVIICRELSVRNEPAWKHTKYARARKQATR